MDDFINNSPDDKDQEHDPYCDCADSGFWQDVASTPTDHNKINLQRGLEH